MDAKPKMALTKPQLTATMKSVSIETADQSPHETSQVFLAHPIQTLFLFEYSEPNGM